MADDCADEGVYLDPAVQRSLRNRLSRVERLARRAGRLPATGELN